MGMPSHDGVDTTDTTGHLQVDIHTVMRQKNYDLRAFRADFVDHLLHVFILNAKCPVSHHVAWVGNRCVGKSLADDGTWHAVHFAHDIGFEYLITKVLGLDILCNEFNFSSKVFLDNFFDTVHAVGEFPVACHDIHTQQLTGFHHVLCICPQRSG